MYLFATLFPRPAGQAEAWRAEAAALQSDISSAALALSQARRAAAGALAQTVQGCLSQLAMGSSRFAVEISWTPAGQAEQQVGGVAGVAHCFVMQQCGVLLCSDGLCAVAD
jgi:DNA repair ATPase RecN